MFQGATLYECQDLPPKTTLKDKFKNGKIKNIIIDKNTKKERNLPSELREVTTSKHGRILGVVDYYYQDRVSKHHKFSDDYMTSVFILSPDDDILVILGRSDIAVYVKNLITKIIDGTQTRVQHFSNLEIPPDPMEKIARRVSNSYEKNWCDRPRITHGAQRYKKRYAFHDYSYGDHNCILETAEFKTEVINSTGISPIVKFFKCEKLDPDISTQPKTMRFKHEGQISTSKNYNFEHWEYFLFDLVIPIIKGK